MIKKGIIGVISLIINPYKNMIKIKNDHILSIGMQITYMDGQCHKTCLAVILSSMKIDLNLLMVS